MTLLKSFTHLAKLLLSYVLIFSPSLLCFAETKETPLEITADSITYFQQENRAVAEGSVLSVQKDQRLTCDKLKAHFSAAASTPSTKTTPKLEKVEAYSLPGKRVMLENSTTRVFGKKAVHNIPTEEIDVWGPQAQLISPDYTVTCETKLSYNKKTEKATAKKNVVFTDLKSKTVLQAPILKVFFKTGDKTAPSEPSNHQSLKKAEAMGGVIVTQEGKMIRGQRALYKENQGLIELFGDVSITHDQNTIVGDYGYMNIHSGMTKVFATPPQSPTDDNTTKEKKKRVRMLLNPQ